VGACEYAKWLTVEFTDLLQDTYTRTPYPLLAHAYPLVIAQFRALCKVMTRGETASMQHFNLLHQRCNNFSDLGSWNNCYGISCHTKSV